MKINLPTIMSFQTGITFFRIFKTQMKIFLMKPEISVLPLKVHCSKMFFKFCMDP